MQEEYKIGANNNLENRFLFLRKYVKYVEDNFGETNLGKIDSTTGNFVRFKVKIKKVNPYVGIESSNPNEIKCYLNIIKYDGRQKFYDYLCKFKTKIEGDIKLPGDWSWGESQSAPGNAGYFSIQFIRKVSDIFDVSKEAEYFDWLYQVSVFFANEFPKYYDEYNKVISNDNDKKEKPENSTAVKGGENIVNQPLNQILYGPPGTGKTFKTKALAVEIITGKKPSDREELNRRYSALVEYGRIQFITFHQSYGYEDFVEGIKPVLNDEQEYENDSILPQSDVSYRIADGIFKELCKEASDEKDSNQDVPFADAQRNARLDPKEYEERKVWQLKIGKSGNLIKYHLDNNEIAIGGFNWFDEYDLESEVVNSQGNINQFMKMLDQHISKQIENGADPNYMLNSDNAKRSMRQFCIEMKEGDLVMVHKRPPHSKSINKEAKQILAVVEIIGGYKYKAGKGYCHTREIKSLWRKEDNGLPMDANDINKGVGLGNSTICNAPHTNSGELIKKVNEEINLPAEKRLFISNPDHPRNLFVLIIDEINRGNISKILGELITLLEEDKRAGNEEALEVTLPYSGDRFSIPKNLYIIGTMNTADRSIAFLDTALRRRFNFMEMMPEPEKLEKNMEGINLQELLKAINANIIKVLDRDRQIGHSYLLKIKDMPDLASAFRHKICPLLEEYFYDRREKIKEVLNDCGLILSKKDDENWEWADYKAFEESTNYLKVYESE